MNTIKINYTLILSTLIMITMEYIKSDFDNKYPILNVELLGKPIILH